MIEQKKKRILIVDDTEANIDILVEALGEVYEISAALDGNTALGYLEEIHPDLILLDVQMPVMDGFTVCKLLKSDARTAEIPVIFLTAMDHIEAKTKGFQLGAADYITKPFEVLEVKARVRNHLLLREAKQSLARQNEILEQLVLERTRELQTTQEVTIQSLSSLAETRDNETGGHIRRTQNYVRLLAERLREKGLFTDFLTPRTLELLPKSAPLHDVGKIGISDGILLKPGKLTADEFQEMKRHTILGRDALLQAESELGTNSFLSHARKIAYSHHEKWDGSGYPTGAAGEDIPIEGRLMAIADVYDALISKRVYKPPFSHTEACRIIQEESEGHFDPVMVETFKEIQEEFRRTALEYVGGEEERAALMN